MKRFSSGTWTHDPATGEIASAECIVCKVYGATVYNYEANAEECTSNARLIASAPEMYELLKSVVEYKPDIVWDVVFYAQKLLARIDGEEAEKHE
ncbi:MAG: hypothetical protein IJS28_07065 [Synergistaceae bacterium]|nr:hypothetical protein [Synergistaceae bacterium]